MKPGDKVVCVDDGPCKWCGAVLPIIKGRIYVVSENTTCPIYGDPGINLIGVPQVRCHEIKRPGKMGFSINRFRKLDELKAEAGLKKKLEQKAIKSLFECLRGIE